MYDTLKYRYAVLLKIKLPEKSTPIGKIERTNISLLIFTSFAPSNNLVVLCKILVPTAANAKWNVTKKTGYLKLRVLYR